jgi:uncharacterized protein (TIGR03437 family)
LFGSNLSSGILQAMTLPLPGTLNSTTVLACADSHEGLCATASLLYVSPTQVNAVIMNEGLPSTLTTYFFVVANGISLSTAVRVPIYPVAPGIFREGYDCPYPVTCALTLQSSASNTRLRGAITDQTEKLITSANPITPSNFYSVYLTGLQPITNPPTVAVQVVNKPQYIVPMVVQYSGPAPGYPGLYQVNFMLPNDVRRALTDGQTIPRCSLTDDKIELMFGLAYSVGSTDLSDWVSIPALIAHTQLQCTS